MNQTVLDLFDQYQAFVGDKAAAASLTLADALLAAQPEPASDTLTAKQAAARLKISLTTLKQLVKADKVTHYRVGRVLRFRACDLEAFEEKTINAKGFSLFKN